MLSSELLRTRIYRGKITPLFCATSFGSDTDYVLASKMVSYFTNAQKDRCCKGDLLKEVGDLESQYDYKLVRGFFALLERRSVFEQINTSSTNATPAFIRQKLFEESSKQGWALSDTKRRQVIQKVAKQLHISSSDIEIIMWGDKDENLILERFDVINPKDLILWYNLSLFQTLLFKCAKLEFYVKGGLYWKQVLRNVKKYGLMYSLEYHKEDGSDKGDSIKCSLEGPLSLFKMTDRYGTSMAKLLPSIVGTPDWSVSGSIVKKMDDGKKIYSFELSNKSTKDILRQIIQSSQHNDNSDAYDSVTEAEFAKKFYQHFDQNDKFGWKISREPDPLIADGKAMIPDFLFERFGRKVYFEIVGFWTREYLERKAAKLKVLFGDENKNIDLLVAVNSELTCSQMTAISTDKIFTFEKTVSIKPVLEHLKKIDAEIVEEKIHTKIKLDDTDRDLLSIKRIALENSLPEAATLKILLADYPNNYTEVKGHLVSKKRISVIKGKLDDGVSKFVDACKILTLQKIPDTCHAELLSIMDYDVIWKDLNPDNAKISKRMIAA